MPYKFDSVPINNPKFDKRVKLTDDDKARIAEEHKAGASIHSLSKKYKVSRRLIQFTLFPERQEKAKADFAVRQKDGRYYDKDKHKGYMKNHREHKKDLWNKGLLEGESMKRLDDATWVNIFRNTVDNEEEVEVIWLDGFHREDGTVDLSRGEWALACGEELFEDGFETEKEAQQRLDELYQKLGGNN